jgi:hypothetical protein
VTIELSSSSLCSLLIDVVSAIVAGAVLGVVAIPSVLPRAATIKKKLSEARMIARRVKVHLGLCVSFGGLMANNYISNIVLRIL